MARKLALSYNSLYKGCAVAWEGLLTWFCESRDYMNGANTSLWIHYDSCLQNHERHVYTHKADKEIRRRSEQTSETVTEPPTHSRRIRNPAETQATLYQRKLLYNRWEPLHFLGQRCAAQRQDKPKNRGMKEAEATSINQWLRDEPQVSVGGLLEQGRNFPDLCS